VRCAAASGCFAGLGCLASAAGQCGVCACWSAAYLSHRCAVPVPGFYLVNGAAELCTRDHWWVCSGSVAACTIMWGFKTHSTLACGPALWPCLPTMHMPLVSRCPGMSRAAAPVACDATTVSLPGGSSASACSECHAFAGASQMHLNARQHCRRCLHALSALIDCPPCVLQMCCCATSDTPAATATPAPAPTTAAARRLATACRPPASVAPPTRRA